MNRRWARVGAWVVLALILLLNLSALLIGAANASAQLSDLAIGATILTYGIVGALISTRQPNNAVGWLLSAFSLLVAIGIFSEQYGIYGIVEHPGALPLAEWVVGPGFWLWTPAVGILLLFVPLFFPNGKLPSPRWRMVALFDAILLSATTVLFAVIPFADATYPAMHNPAVVFMPEGVANTIMAVSIMALTACSILSVIALLTRFRRADAVERQQLKWVLAAAAFMAGSFLVNTILIDWLKLQSLTGVVNVITDLAILSLPVAIGVAVLKYRLWDIDLIIRKTVTYALVVVLLAMVYLGAVIFLQRVVSSLMPTQQSDLVTVISTLAIAALFVPVRNRIQDVIDRRFYRHKYDAQKVLELYANTVRDETDLERLTGRLTQVVDETMQPKSVSVWLRQAEHKG